MLLGAQRGSDGTTVATGTRASLSIAKLNVYDEAIAAADINCLFNEDGAADGRSHPFIGWIAEFLAVVSLNRMNEDPDGDGVLNGLENFFGTVPDEYSPSFTSTDLGPSTSTFTSPPSGCP